MSHCLTTLYDRDRDESSDFRAAVLRKVVRASTIDLIVDQIRNAIYSGSLEPGQSINEVRTAELLEVSRPSLRRLCSVLSAKA